MTQHSIPKSATVLLGDAVLEKSSIVVNCRMNRERTLTGSNGYSKELGYSPLDLLRGKTLSGRKSWLDLCCGSGKALIEAATTIHAEGLDGLIEIVGVDLVGMFSSPDSPLECLQLIEASLNTWRPNRLFDVISCVHGLHYIGDKLGLITRIASWLTDQGRFTANLTLDNFRLDDGSSANRVLAAEFRKVGLQYDTRKKRLICEGRKLINLPLRYLGADDQTGPNYTGQAAVDSYYARIV